MQQISDPNSQQFDVVLTGVGPNKINLIKAIRESSGRGLKEAKDLADMSNSVSLRIGRYTRSQAEIVRDRLFTAGATVEVTSSSTGEVIEPLVVIARTHNADAVLVSSLEALADQIIAYEKLKSYRPLLLVLRQGFKKLETGQLIKGCSTWGQFVELHLHVSPRALRYMLSGGNRKRAIVIAAGGTRLKQIQLVTGQLQKLLNLEYGRRAPDVRSLLQEKLQGGIVVRGQAIQPKGIVGRVLDFVRRSA